jgi:hypothetical protein
LAIPYVRSSHHQVAGELLLDREVGGLGIAQVPVRIEELISNRRNECRGRGRVDRSKRREWILLAGASAGVEKLTPFSTALGLKGAFCTKLFHKTMNGST